MPRQVFNPGQEGLQGQEGLLFLHPGYYGLVRGSGQFLIKPEPFLKSQGDMELPAQGPYFLPKGILVRGGHENLLYFVRMTSKDFQDGLFTPNPFSREGFLGKGH